MDETQMQKTLNHLKKYGNITSLDIFKISGSLRASAIIYNLRHKKGYKINSVWEKTDKGKRYARYILVPDDLEGGNNV